MQRTKLYSRRSGVALNASFSASALTPAFGDPFVNESPLIAEGEKGLGWLGWATALSGDGNTALVGIPNEEGKGGGVAVFALGAGGWSVQGPNLRPSDESEPEDFGGSVSLATDGNTALIGGVGEPPWASADGDAWVFTRTGSSWAQDGSALEPAGMAGEAKFGGAVALSGDGQTAVVGGEADDEGKGAAWVFSRTGSTWSEQGAKLTPNDEVGPGDFGSSVAISSDGNTAAIGGYGDSGGRGAIWIFTRSGSTWKQQGQALLGDLNPYSSYLGMSVAISADGSTVIAGAPYGGGGDGAVWVFSRAGTKWNSQGQLTSASAGGYAGFGDAVAVSDEGDVALVGGEYDAGGAGAAWVFTRDGTIWSEQEELPGSAVSAGSGFGRGVGVSADGRSAIVGAPFGADDVGQAWLYGHPPPIASTGSTTAVAQTTAQVTATVDPRSAETSGCRFEYGPTTAYGAATTCVPWPGSAQSTVAVEGKLAGLTPYSTYHFRIAATTASGTAYGADGSFRTLPEPPAVTTLAPTAVGSGSAQLNAEINAWGAPLASCVFEYGASSSYGNITPCAETGLPDAGTMPVSALIAAKPSRLYHFRATAHSEGGQSSGGDLSFTSAATPPPQLESHLRWILILRHGHLIVASLAVEDLPRTATLVVSCHGSGCPFARRRFPVSRNASRCLHTCGVHAIRVQIASIFKRRALAAGTHIVLRVTNRGGIGKIFKLTLRSNSQTQLRTECMAPPHDTVTRCT